LGQPTILVAVHRNPHVERVIQTLRATPEMDSPQLVFTRNVPQRLERDRNFNRVTIARHHSLRIHYEIETEVFALSFGPDTVCLNAERIEVKLVSASLIVEGVEENADVIVVPDLVALRNVGAYLRGIVVTVESDIEKPRIVAKHDFGAIFRNQIVTGLNLVEVFQYGRRLPHV